MQIKKKKRTVKVFDWGVPKELGLPVEDSVEEVGVVDPPGAVLTNKREPKSSRHRAILSPLDMLRIRVWYEMVEEATSAKTPHEVRAWVNLHGVVGDDLDKTEWELYKGRKQRPSEKTLLAVEKVIGVPASIYIEGEFPHQWAILNGDLVHALESVEEIIIKSGNTEAIDFGSSSPMDKVVWFWILLCNKFVSGDFENAIAKMGNIESNEVLKTYRLAQNDANIRLADPYIIIATLGLWIWVKNKNEQLGLLSQYLVQGVLSEPILTEFPSYGQEMKNLIIQSFFEK